MASKLQTDIKEWLKPRCCWVQVNTSGIRGGYWVGMKGLPDIMGCTKQGKMFFIEVKRTNEKLTPKQATFLDKMEGFGHIAVTARSLDYVQRVFKELY